MRDLDRRRIGQARVPIDVVRGKRLLEPVDIVVGKHLCALQSVFEAHRPVGIAAPRVNEQLRIVAESCASSLHELLVGRKALLPERVPAELDGAEAAG